jgi:hypothetical protein
LFLDDTVMIAYGYGIAWETLLCSDQ